ncbi:type II toxin-antitoxin system HicB family antitoxin [Pantoea sp.]|uniref:type II toxin-antitoxin system HicB family antitoxin n=1 Tax=Pantoea sp. TaxID=69393 RepID=UPI0028A69CFF|nr:type II toxin-antitoxin system HicB family antitoxin [Pantoea sp.]
MFNYAVRLTHDLKTDSWEVSCRDLPLLHSVGDTIEEALAEAADGLVAAISLEMDARRPIPLASDAQQGEYIVSVPVLVAMKAALYNAMIETGTRKADLARQLGVNGPQVDRLLDVEHSSKVEKVELALAQLGRKARVEILI